jgi:tetratricopeptide (TPR) repeat protein
VSRARSLALGCLVLAFVAGCAARVPIFAPVPVQPLRLHEIAGDGDAARRASQRLVIQGLGLDAKGQARLARTSYERALQVDVNNPFAYLALARQAVDAGDGASALEYLEQAELLLGAEDLRSPRVEPHLAGIRGGALLARGDQAGGEVLLARASALAPTVWSDGRLSAAELR